ncbi:hypothetical protein C8039_14525 [Halogeometricum sp. wsp3]|nr:hypothetical protein C8039_14525 [Halogeometricum sp. wsp3]
MECADYFRCRRGLLDDWTVSSPASETRYCPLAGRVADGARTTRPSTVAPRLPDRPQDGLELSRTPTDRTSRSRSVCDRRDSNGYQTPVLRSAEYGPYQVVRR